MDEIYIGAIELFPYTFAPVDWALCDGSRLSIQAYQALYSLIGITYGGDGQTYFLLPNLQGYEPIPGMQYYIALNGMYPVRN